MSEVPSHELYSLLVPLAQERLIVPRACVAEVVTWQQPEKMEGAPPWYLGTIHWSGRAVPVISFEAACGQSPPAPGTRTRIVIFVALSSQIAGGYFGVITQGFPPKGYCARPRARPSDRPPSARRSVPRVQRGCPPTR